MPALDFVPSAPVRRADGDVPRRRSVLRSAAWAAPAAVLVSAAPALAASPPQSVVDFGGVVTVHSQAQAHSSNLAPVFTVPTVGYGFLLVAPGGHHVRDLRK